MSTKRKHYLAAIAFFAAGAITAARTVTDPHRALLSWDAALLALVWALGIAGLSLLESTRNQEDK